MLLKISGDRALVHVSKDNDLAPLGSMEECMEFPSEQFETYWINTTTEWVRTVQVVFSDVQFAYFGDVPTTRPMVGNDGGVTTNPQGPDIMFTPNLKGIEDQGYSVDVETYGTWLHEPVPIPHRNVRNKYVPHYSVIYVKERDAKIHRMTKSKEGDGGANETEKLFRIVLDEVPCSTQNVEGR